MSMEIAYNISSSSGLDPGKNVISSLDTVKGDNKGKQQTDASIGPPGPSANNSASSAAHAVTGKNDERKAAQEEFIKTLKEEFDLINQVKLKFSRDYDTGQPFIEIVDKDSGDVVREIPPEFMRKLAEKMDEMVGILFDQKA